MIVLLKSANTLGVPKLPQQSGPFSLEFGLMLVSGNQAPCENDIFFSKWMPTLSSQGTYTQEESNKSLVNNSWKIYPKNLIHSVRLKANRGERTEGKENKKIYNWLEVLIRWAQWFTHFCGRSKSLWRLLVKKEKLSQLVSRHRRR